MPKHANVVGSLIISEKQCKTCKEWKPIIDFYSAGLRKDGLGVKYQPYCKVCDNARKSEYVVAHRFKDRENSKKKRLKRKRGVSWYGNRESFCKRRFQVGFNLLSDSQKKIIMLTRLYFFGDYLTIDEMKNISLLIENKSYDSVSKIIFKSFMERL